MEGDESVRKRIAAVAAGSGAVGQLSLSSGNVDAGVLDDGEKAFAGFANYNLSPVRGFVAEIPLKTRYSRVETLDGAEVKVEWDGTVVRCTFDPADADSIGRSILIWLDTKSFPETVVSAPRFIAGETP